MMTNRLARAALPVTALAVLACGAVEAQVTDNARPNILLVIADDVGLDVNSTMYPGLIDELMAQYGPAGRNHPDVAAIRGRPASTPVLDDLARGGMRFTNVWAHPFCSPTRAAILTGLFAAETRVVNYQNALADSHSSFVERLRSEGGYSTALFGKWHLAGLGGGGGARAGGTGARAGGPGGRAGGPGARAGGPGAQAPGGYEGMLPKKAGFELFRGQMGAAIQTFWDYDYQIQDADTPADRVENRPPPERALPGIAATTFAPVVKVADTIEWITARETDDPDKPWFAWLAFNLSHATSGRAPAQMAVPNADTLDPVSRREMEACGGVFGTQDTGQCSGEAQMRAMTNALDTLLGKLLEAVDALDPNTYVIYVGDNGTPMYGRPNLDFIDNMYITRTGRGKGTVYESGARVALVIRGPGIAAGSRSDAVSHVVDLYSTTLTLAGLQIPDRVPNSDGSRTVPLDARTLGPVLFDGATTLRDPDQGYVLTESEDLMRNGIREVGARNSRYKVLCTETTDNCRFYDLGNDPLEEYPLEIPASCDAYRDGSWTPANAEWHYCRLTDVVDTRSFM